MANADIIVRIIDQTGPGAGQVQQNLNGVDRSSKTTDKSMAALATKILAVGTALTAAAVAGAQYIDQVQNINNRLKLVTESQGELNTRFNEIADIATRTRAGLGETAELYTRIALSADTVGLNTAEALTVTENFNKVLAISGSTGTEAASAILQFSQALASGTLRGDEFRSITEAAPKLLQILEKQLGVTRAQLREYAGKGLLNAELVSRALIAATQDLDEQFAKTDVTIGQATTNINTAFLVMVDDFNKATGAGEKISAVMTSIAENMDIAFTAAGILAGLIGGALLVAFGAVTVPVAAVVAAVIGLSAAFVAFYDDVVNFIDSALTPLIAAFVGAKAALLDPLNAIEAYNTAFDNYTSSARIAREGTDKLTSSLVDQNGKIKDNSASTDNNTEVKDDNTNVVDDNSGAVDENGRRLGELIGDLEGTAKATDKVSTAYRDFTTELERSAEMARLDTDTREIQQNVYRGLTARAQELGVTVAELSATERRQVTERVTQLTELEQKNKTYQDNLRDYDTDTQSIIKQNFRDTSTAIEQIEREKQEYLRNARAVGKENSITTQDAILAYDRMIQREQIKLNDELQKEIEDRHRAVTDFAKKSLEEQETAYETYARRVSELNAALNDGIMISEEEKLAYMRQLNSDYVNSTVSEYNDLYGLLEEKVMDFTGLSKKEYGILEEVVQLTFGVNITDIIKGTFASGIQAITGFRTGGVQQIGTMPGQTQPIFDSMGNQIGNTFTQNGLGSIGGFVTGAFQLLGGLATDIFSLFGGVGDFLGNIFGGAFSSISSGIGSIFGSGGGGGGIGSSIGGAIGSIFGPIGTALGSIFGGLFAEGGYLPSGQFGIAGESGPEIVTGPAFISSASDSAAMMGGGGGVNVTFNINAVDSRGIDQLLTERKGFITDLVRSAVEERPTRRTQGAY